APLRQAHPAASVHCLPSLRRDAEACNGIAAPIPAAAHTVFLSAPQVATQLLRLVEFLYAHQAATACNGIAGPTPAMRRTSCARRLRQNPRQRPLPAKACNGIAARTPAAAGTARAGTQPRGGMHRSLCPTRDTATSVCT